MEQATLDLRQNLRIDIFLDKDVIYFPSIENIPLLDSNYTIIFDNITYSVGNGLTLSNNSIIWELNTSVFDIGKYEGVLESQSKIAGVYLKILINLNIE
jgi:hypothetical protein